MEWYQQLIHTHKHAHLLISELFCRSGNALCVCWPAWVYTLDETIGWCPSFASVSACLLLSTKYCLRPFLRLRPVRKRILCACQRSWRGGYFLFRSTVFEPSYLLERSQTFERTDIAVYSFRTRNTRTVFAAAGELDNFAPLWGGLRFVYDETVILADEIILVNKKRCFWYICSTAQRSTSVVVEEPFVRFGLSQNRVSAEMDNNPR